MDPSVHSSTVYNSQHIEAIQVSIKRWMDKKDVGCKHSGILLSHKKEWNSAICSNIARSRDYYA